MKSAKPKCKGCNVQPVNPRYRYFCSQTCAAISAISALDYQMIEWCGDCQDWVDTSFDHKHETVSVKVGA